MNIGEVEYPSLKGKVSDAEWLARVELAAIYRLYREFGWWDMLQAAASARVPDEAYYLFAPAGCAWDDVTASSLVKITLDGQVVSNSPFGIVRDNWYPMQAVHGAREDANFVIHTHDSYAIALSVRKEGLLPISQTSAVVLGNKFSSHEYEGVETYEQAIPGLQKGLGDANILLLRGHGALSVGRVAYEAVVRMDQLLLACKQQVLAGRGDEIHQLPADVVATFPYEIERSASYPTQWQGLLRRLDRIDPTYRD